MNLLVVGANGILGSNVLQAGHERGWDVSGTYHSTRPAFDVPLAQFDLEAAGAFDDILAEHEPDVVINCAAMTDVDDCERNPDRAHLLNGDAPGKLAFHCESAGVEFVHISTDYVFDGSADEPYVESADPNPVQTYGESKLAGERAVRANVTDPLVARLSFVWGIHRSSGDLTGFPAWVRGQLQSGDDVPLFTDQWVTPTRAGQAAVTLLDLVEQEASGTFHIAAPSCVMPFEFGAVLADAIDESQTRLVEGSTDDVEREATRPTYSCLAVEKVESALGRPQPTVRDDVAAVVDAFRYI
ncbi:SDR family oxidoreductase [Haloarcula onubensis]|uniref:SDR family oxidoreductase n=1 Tax=Haloarcula onubensis TaxID=2950539 RepID=A0ABU2FJ51_9EURY|nr:SDR family oxidoreductase [Halomicroarcula sp. S3CR25-11]MDS0280778.1 SDR family oxidoreductase [Halomicroarcula sp. S3CR25-11]